MPGVYVYNAQQERYELVERDIDAYRNTVWQNAHDEMASLVEMLECTMHSIG